MKRAGRMRDCLASLLALVLGMLIVFPLIYALCGAFKTEAEFFSDHASLLPQSFLNTENFSAVWRRIPIPRMFLNSLAVATLAAVVRVIFAALAAYAVTFFDFKGKNALFILILCTMMLPQDTLIITNYRTVSRLGLVNTYLGMAILSFLGAGQMLMLRQTFRKTPAALRESAMMDGCGDLRYMRRILLPLSRPVLSTLFVQSFVSVWNGYLWPLLVTNREDMRTIQVGITMLTTYESTNYHEVLAGSALSLIPAVILFVFLRKNMLRAMTAGAVVE